VGPSPESLKRSGSLTPFLVGEADPSAQVRAEDPVLFNQIRDSLLPLAGPPPGHGHDEESKRGDIHDRGSLKALGREREYARI